MHDFIYPLVDVIIIPMLDMRKQRPRDLPKVLKLVSGEARVKAWRVDCIRWFSVWGWGLGENVWERGMG